MALLDIFKGKKGKDEKLKRPPKGALKRVEKPVKREPVHVSEESKTEKKQEGKKEGSSELASIMLSSPHITEKSAFSAESGVYAFKVSSRANKVMVRRAVKELYGFEPIKINMLNMPGKTRFVRGRKGSKPGYKKAVIFLKEGDKIELS